MNIYSIIPLLSENENEIIEDIAAQHAGGVADCFLFSMTLAPKGTPPLDLAGGLCARYRRFKAALDARRIPNGVLIQASIGHEYYQNSTRDFQHFVNLTDGQTTNTCCPLDEAFLSYIGLGVPIPNASWGTLAQDGVRLFVMYPHQLFLPAFFISITMLSFNLLGDGMRDAFDPRLRR